MRKQPSDTYKLLYDHIIEDLLFQICNSGKGYCIRYEEGKEQIPIIIWEKFEEYKSKALINMSGGRLDRHKLASCICGAIIEVRPLTGINGAKIKKNANEILALSVGLNIIKFYMMRDLLYNLDDSEHKRKAIKYLKSNFNMEFPPLKDNICDTQEYRKNIENALFWSHHKCEITQKMCFHYDIWAYSKIFYHLEIYNKANIEKAYQEFEKLAQEQEN